MGFLINLAEVSVVAVDFADRLIPRHPQDVASPLAINTAAAIAPTFVLFRRRIQIIYRRIEDLVQMLFKTKMLRKVRRDRTRKATSELGL
jgi:hypothetical protein